MINFFPEKLVCSSSQQTISVDRFAHSRGAPAMYKSFSKSQARRRLRRLLALVSQGQTFVITKHGKAACLLLEEKREGSIK
jgi:hypothetical protein